MRLTLGKKAFIWFLLFELCNLAIFGGLLYLQKQAERESLREETAKRIVGETEQLAYDFQEAGASIVKFCVNRNVQSLKRYDEVSSEVPEKLRWLREQYSNDPDEAPIFARLEKNCDELMEVFATTRQSVENRSGLDGLAIMQSTRDRVQPKLNEMIKDGLRLAEKQKKIIDESPEHDRLRRNRADYAIYMGCGISVSLAALALVAFLKSVTGRLQIMGDNARRLAAEEELQPPLPGTDEISHLDGVFHDMADALKRAQAAEQEIEEMRKAFVAMVSHDLRSPLNSVQGFLELLEMGAMGEISEPARNAAQRAMVNTSRLIRLINDLLDLEKMESGTIVLKPVCIRVSELIDESIEAVRVVAERQSVRIVRCESDAEIVADHDRLVQVLVNLLSNAIKFSAAQSVVEIKVIEDSDWVELRIKDHGRGVPAKYRELIFEKFQQVEESDNKKKGGTGLGLPICKSIIELHGGSIAVDSEEGVGSEFWFKLPRSVVVSNAVQSSEVVHTGGT